MTLKELYRKHKKGWIEMGNLKPDDYEIQRYLYRLDQVASNFEAVWGVDVLPRLVSKETAERWEMQVNKMNDAITSGDLTLVKELVEGTIRGWKALEAEALKAGHFPNDPDVWDFQHPESGRKYRICKNHYDASKAAEQDVVVYTLAEVARLLEANELTNVIKSTFDGAEVTGVSSKEAFSFDSDQPDLPPEF